MRWSHSWRHTTSLNQVLAMGADDRLYKPIPVSILETRVKSLLQREKARRQAPSQPAAS
ncbi:MAG: hypothetical protein HYY65_11260 [Candidatus Tectomicrobia bacterium]|uniref:Response regulatory domain-containing protein n=1 Tax=Tectimicrobiota bacterium TaxID=2528274 RepID=A0A932M1K4_UNCTE|nr:hypothetical protein [Candidatus Tectomicrobia bacterium]